MMKMISLASPSLQFLQPPHKWMKPALLPLFSRKSLSWTSFSVHESRSLLHSSIHNSSGGGVELDLQQEKGNPTISSGSVIDIEGNLLAAGLRREAMPNHIGLILDGNMRWAKMHNLPASVVHERVPMVTHICCQCIRFGIPVLTAFIWNTQNWTRPNAEIKYVMHIFENYMKMQLENFIREGIQVSFIGDCSKLPISFQEVTIDIEKATKNNTKLHLIYAVSYGGQYDILQACRSIAHKAKHGLIEPEEIDESLFEQHLETNCTKFSCPDLVIRTGGGFTLSNFFLWQMAYTELVFTKPLWPDFGESEFIEALRTFQQRERTFGQRVP